jgi:hypothetical protein
MMRAAAAIAVLGWSAIGAGAQVRTMGSAANNGYFGAPLYPYGYNPSSFFLGGQVSVLPGIQPYGYTIPATSDWLLPPIVSPANDTYNNETYNGFPPTLGNSQIYEEGYNGRYYEAQPTIAPANGLESYDYDYGYTNPATGAVSARVPPAAPTNPPAARTNPVRLIHRLYGRVEIQYRGNTVNVDNITLSLLDRNRRVVTQAVRTEPPATATLTRYNTVRYYAVKVQFNDGTARTFTGVMR